MKKKLLLIFTVLFSAITSYAYDFEFEGIYYNIISLEDLTCEVTNKDDDYNTYSGDIDIPSTFIYKDRTFTVTSIGNNAFYNCKNITSVTIPNTVMTIETFAFAYCDNLTTLTMSNSLTTIGSSAFMWCTKLNSFPLPNTLTTIKDMAFVSCYNIDSIMIPNSVIELGKQAFSWCKGMKSATIPNTITSLEATFYNCRSLTSVVIPNSITSIDQFAFTNTCITDYICDNEKYVDYFSNSVINLTLGENVNQIECDLSGWTNLKSITIENNNPPTFNNPNPFTDYQHVILNIYVPGKAIDKYKEADIWKDFWEIYTIEGSEEGDTPESKQCAVPTIKLVNDELVATSTTEGAKCYINITSEDIKSVYCESISLTGVYNVSAYAYADGCLNSETVTAKVIWVNPSLDESGILSMEAKKAVLIRVQDGNIIVSGTEIGESIQLYSIDARQLCNVSANDGETIIPCNLDKGEMVIVHYGGKSVKILM